MNLLSIVPELILFCGALIILMIDVFFGKKLKNPPRFAFLGSIVFVITALVILILSYNSYYIAFGNMLFDNRFTSFTKIITLSLLLLTLFMSAEFMQAEKRISAEFVALMMIATTGSMILLSSNDLLPFYMALELQALPLYILAAIKRESSKSSESGMKYFILGAVSSAILLLGISMIYGFSGNTNFSAIYQVIISTGGIGHVSIGVLFGFTLVLIAMLFKISAVPFHMWTPDVYEGASTIVSTFFASTIKFVSMVVLARIYINLASIWMDINQILILVAILSLLVGCLGAIKQNNLKRMLAYSSIGHVGFILAGLAALSIESIQAAILYMVIYATMALGSFAFLMLINNQNIKTTFDKKNDQLYKLSSVAGIGKTNPVIAMCLAILMFSMAGIPPMAGFFSKFYILMAVIKKGFYSLAVIAVLASVISAFYYLRIIKIMYFDDKDEDIQVASSHNAVAILAITASISLLFMAYMKPFLAIIAGIF